MAASGLKPRQTLLYWTLVKLYAYWNSEYNGNQGDEDPSGVLTGAALVGANAGLAGRWAAGGGFIRCKERRRRKKTKTPFMWRPCLSKRLFPFLVFSLFEGER